MMYFKKINLLFLLIFLGSLCHAQTDINPDKNFHLYILMGQSNMAGRGEVEGELKTLKHNRVYMLDKNGEWQTAINPIHFDKPSAVGVGPGLSFGIDMAKTDSAIRIGLIPCAVGGTSIQKWQVGAYDKATNTYPYDDAVLRIKNAMKYGVVKGVIWHQGESNSSVINGESYLSQLDDLISRVRKLTGDAKLPVVVGELGQYKEQYQNFNKVLAKVPSKYDIQVW